VNREQAAYLYEWVYRYQGDLAIPAHRYKCCFADERVPVIRFYIDMYDVRILGNHRHPPFTFCFRSLKGALNVLMFVC